MRNECCHYLFARPQPLGPPHCRLRHLHAVHVCDDLCARQPTHSYEQQLLELRLCQECVLAGELHGTRDVVLDESPQRRPVSGPDVLIVGVADEVRLRPGQLALHEVAVHLVAVEVRVVGVAVGVVHAQRLLLHVPKHACLVRHDAGLVQGGLSVDQQHVSVDEVAVHLDAGVGEQQLGLARTLHVRELVQFDDTPVRHLDLVRTWVLKGPSLHERAKVLHVPFVDRGGVVKGLGELDGYSDLVGADVGVGRDDRAAAEVDSLAHHVSSEKALFPLQ
mmetsp:Transcript_34065/g.75084  ORF Transcript_34065/g.75084 Transcript_34065/m.75084 type:complete len:277 (+) Transcript_34065:2236-3066(+)